jgi:hypothetical protein
MLQFLGRRGCVTCPAPEVLVPHVLGPGDPTIAKHVEGCSICQTELARLREAAGLLRIQTSGRRQTETPDCLEETMVVDFVEGRLTPEERAPLVVHLLTCARCRSVVAATARLVADERVAREIPRAIQPRWQRWSLVVGLAAAAAVLLLVWPRDIERGDSTPGMREPARVTMVAPVPIAPRAPTARVSRFVWSSMPGVDRYRVRLYDDQGALRWTAEAPDTSLALPDSVVLSAPATYFWKVEGQTDWRRWAASDLVEFRLTGPTR